MGSVVVCAPIAVSSTQDHSESPSFVSAEMLHGGGATIELIFLWAAASHGFLDHLSFRCTTANVEMLLMERAENQVLVFDSRKSTPFGLHKRNRLV